MKSIGVLRKHIGGRTRCPLLEFWNGEKLARQLPYFLPFAPGQVCGYVPVTPCKLAFWEQGQGQLAICLEPGGGVPVAGHRGGRSSGPHTRGRVGAGGCPGSRRARDCLP